MEIFTKNSAKCTIFQRNDCNNFSSLMQYVSKATFENSYFKNMIRVGGRDTSWPVLSPYKLKQCVRAEFKTFELQEFDWSLVRHSEFLTMTCPPPGHVQQLTTLAPKTVMHSPMWLNAFFFFNRIMLFVGLSLICGENPATRAQSMHS
jgi:hypothetical protein